MHTVAQSLSRCRAAMVSHVLRWVLYNQAAVTLAIHWKLHWILLWASLAVACLAHIWFAYRRSHHSFEMGIFLLLFFALKEDRHCRKSLMSRTVRNFLHFQVNSFSLSSARKHREEKRQMHIQEEYLSSLSFIHRNSLHAVDGRSLTAN